MDSYDYSYFSLSAVGPLSLLILDCTVSLALHCCLLTRNSLFFIRVLGLSEILEKMPLLETSLDLLLICFERIRLTVKAFYDFSMIKI